MSDGLPGNEAHPRPCCQDIGELVSLRKKVTELIQELAAERGESAYWKETAESLLRQGSDNG